MKQLKQQRKDIYTQKSYRLFACNKILRDIKLFRLSLFCVGNNRECDTNTARCDNATENRHTQWITRGVTCTSDLSIMR